MDRQTSLARTLTQVAREMHETPDLATTLDAIVHSAAETLPGLDHVGISLGHRGGVVETQSGTDQLVWDLDALQYGLGEGPCLHSLDADPVTLVNHLSRDPRWPRYAPRAAELGLRSQMGLRLYLDDQTLGVLNLYCTEAEEIDPDVAHAAELFATHAALALGRARRESQLSEALATRKVIGQAVGIVMERYQLDEDRAFQYLVRVSRGSNIKLRDIAQELIRTANQQHRVRSGQLDGAGAPLSHG